MQFEHLLRLLIFTSAPSLATFWPPPSSASSRRAITSKSLATYTWPDHPVKRGGVSDAKALVFISHGYAEHLHPYYDSLGKACAARGLICWGHDHIGHGTSPGRRTEVDGMENYIDPLVEACKEKRKEHPGLPLFLMGHSMGGLIALTAAIQNPTLFDGLLLTAPLLHSAEDNPTNRALTTMFTMLCPTCSLPFLKLDEKKAVKSKSWQRYIRNDPLMYHGGYKFAAAQVLIDGTEWALRHLQELKTPLLVLHGVEDEMVLVSGSRELVKRARSRDKGLVMIPNASHHVLLDRPTLVENTLLEWVVQRS